MQSFTGYLPARSRLRVDYHVGDVGACAADSLLHLACARVSVCERGAGGERQRDVREQALVGVEEAKLARWRAGRLADDASDTVDIGVVDALSCGGLGERLEMRLHDVDLGNPLA